LRINVLLSSGYDDTTVGHLGPHGLAKVHGSVAPEEQNDGIDGLEPAFVARLGVLVAVGERSAEMGRGADPIAAVDRPLFVSGERAGSALIPSIPPTNELEAPQ
jgi:hypothetical protein